MSAGDEYLVLGIMAAVVAGDSGAVEDLLRALTAQNARLAGEILEAMGRGLSARSSPDSGTGPDA